MTLRKLVLATVAAMLVTGCGGAGGGNPDEYNPTHNDTPSSQDLKDGLAYLNTIRVGAGLKKFRYYKTLEDAARNHGNYIRDIKTRYNVLIRHEEPAQYESRYRTGQWGTERAHHAGYTGFWAGNDISYDVSNGAKGIVRVLLTTVYHRFFITSPEIDEVGMWVLPYRDDAFNVGLVDFGMRRSTMSTLAEQSPEIIVYPYRNQKDANVFFGGNEWPNPLEGLDFSSTSGNPVTVEFNKAKITNVTLTSFSLKDASGADVDIALRLTKANDRNGKLTDHQFAFFPRESLAYDENYTAKITYVADGKAGSKEWTFHTIAAPEDTDNGGTTGTDDSNTTAGGGNGSSAQPEDYNVTDTNQTFVVQSDIFNIFHILPGNDSIGNYDTLGNTTIEGKTADNRDNSFATYDDGNDVRIKIHGQTGDWIVVTFENLKNKKTGEKFKVRVEAR